MNWTDWLSIAAIVISVFALLRRGPRGFIGPIGVMGERGERGPAGECVHGSGYGLAHKRGSYLSGPRTKEECYNLPPAKDKRNEGE